MSHLIVALLFFAVGQWFGYQLGKRPEWVKARFWALLDWVRERLRKPGSAP
jgi:hypothetical protein